MRKVTHRAVSVWKVLRDMQLEAEDTLLVDALADKDHAKPT